MTALDRLLQGLRMRAEKACPGPWEVRYRDIDNKEQAKIWAETYGWLITKGDLPRAYHDPSMDHIAGASPDVILALVQIIERQRNAIQAYLDCPVVAMASPQREDLNAINAHMREALNVEAIAAKIEKEIG